VILLAVSALMRFENELIEGSRVGLLAMAKEAIGALGFEGCATVSRTLPTAFGLPVLWISFKVKFLYLKSSVALC
jgi:hypothetical protein